MSAKVYRQTIQITMLFSLFVASSTVSSRPTAVSISPELIKERYCEIYLYQYTLCNLYSGCCKKDFIESETVDEIVIDRSADQSRMAKLFNHLKAGDRLTVFTICELGESDCEIYELVNKLPELFTDL